MHVEFLDTSKPKRELYTLLAGIARGAYVNAYPPFSDFKVGTALLTWDGRVYTGVNTENTGLNLTIHGEMSAVNAAISDGVLRQAANVGLNPFNCFKAIAVTCEQVNEAWPCGHCRDYLSSFGVGMDVVVPDNNNSVLWKSLKRVLPFAPPAQELIRLTRSGDLLKALDQAHQVRPPHKAGHIELTQSKSRIHGELLQMALNAAQLAYAPYSKRPSGAAVLLYDGSVYTGGSVENVGYTLSAQPEQVALNAAIANGALQRAVRAGVDPHDFVKAVAYAPLGQPNTWPSGSSRQCLCEWGLKMEVVVANSQGKAISRSLAKLLPGAFVPSVLSYWTTRT
jgi:cytidine deaminase